MKQQREDFNAMLNQLNKVDSTGANIKGGMRIFYRSLYLVLKRSIDITVSVITLAVLSPLLGLVALIIKLTDGGPVFYFSKRVGKHGETFDFPKFRSMVIKAEDLKDDIMNENQHGENQITFKAQKDPRVTPIGKWIRRFSIDEMPQLWCVLKGTMTLVGPRPPIPGEVNMYNLKEMHRLDVTPGITCIWQVSGRGDIPFPEQLKMDMHYIRNKNLLLDIKILLQTIPAVITGKGAY